MTWVIQGRDVAEPASFEQATESFVKYKGVLTRLEKKLHGTFKVCQACRTFDEGIFQDLNQMWKEYAYKVKFLETYNEKRNGLAEAEDSPGIFREGKDTTRVQDCGNDFEELVKRGDQMYGTYMELRILMVHL